MNIPRLLISIVSAIVFFFVYDFIVHQVLLGETYGATKEYWRPEAEMMSRMWIMYVGYAVIATGFVTIWALAFPGKGAKCGAIYGFLISLISVGGLVMNTVFMVIPNQVILPWIISGVIGSILTGVLVALVYKPKSA